MHCFLGRTAYVSSEKLYCLNFLLTSGHMQKLCIMRSAHCLILGHLHRLGIRIHQTVHVGKTGSRTFITGREVVDRTIISRLLHKQYPNSQLYTIQDIIFNALNKNNAEFVVLFGLRPKSLVLVP